MSNGMIHSAKEGYREDGFTKIARMAYIKLMKDDRVKNTIVSNFGEEFHMKLFMAPLVRYWPHIEEPRSFSEKIQHRKFYTNEEKLSQVEDKYRVREYVKERVEEQILPELYHVTDDPEDIPFDELPEKFVVKANHGSGWNYIVQNKEEYDFEEIKEKCREWLRSKYGQAKYEYWYDEIEPKIVIEEFIESDQGRPKDYKFFVFHGEVKYIQTDYGRGTNNHTRTMYDKEWNAQDFELKYPRGPDGEKPPNLEKMVEIAENLGEEFDFIRVDLYNPEEGKIFFGELTAGPGSGIVRLKPKKMDFEIGKYW